MTEQPIFETERLACRHLSAADFDAMMSVYGDADAMRWVDDGQPIEAEETKAWIDITLENYRKRGYGMFALVDRATQTVFGFCGLIHPGGQEEAEVKYALLRSHWGKGLATEAVRGLVAYGKREHGLSHIIATVAPDNLASERVLTKAGFAKTDLLDNDDGTQTQLFEWHSSVGQ